MKFIANSAGNSRIMKKAFKIVTTIPEEYSDRLMDAINEVLTPFYPGYDRTFCMTRVTGTWRPLEGSDPFIGTTGVIETADEIRIEFIVRKKDLRCVLNKISEMHPYEEPAIDVIPCLDWKSLI